jgi:16S rRNA (cytosine1402-N4)-methyltransferase
VSFHHRPVLLSQVVDHLQVRPGRRYLDGTLGGGGHAAAVIEAGGTVVGIDRDPNALAAATARLDGVEGFTALRGRFADMAQLAGHLAPFDGILLDLGVSSPQLDTPQRGFSLRRDGPVDMRMDPDQPLDAAGMIDEMDEAELVDILFRYGEEPRARRIARAILEGRPWSSTAALAARVASASGYRNSRTHPATRTFQALRMAVNGELDQLATGLEAALSMLNVGGRLAIISFHSLEDRMVKRRFFEAAGRGTPRDPYGHPVTPPIGRLVVPRGIAGSKHDADNPRSRSARLRVLEYCGPPPRIDALYTAAGVAGQELS